MAARILVVDSGGVTRQVKNGRLHVVDSGGTTRKIKRAFVIDGGGTARLVYKAELGTIAVTCGTATNGLDTANGYDSGVTGFSIGSRSPVSYTDGGGVVRVVRAAVSFNFAFTFWAIQGINVPNADTTFSELTIGATVLTRSSAVYVANHNGILTYWRWNVNVFPSSGVVNVVVS